MRWEAAAYRVIILQYTTDRYCATVKNNWENYLFFFSLSLSFVKYLCQYWEYSDWQLRTQRCTLPVWGKGKEKQRYQKRNRSNNTVGLWVRKSKSYNPQWDNKLLNTVEASSFLDETNGWPTVQKAVWNIFCEETFRHVRVGGSRRGCRQRCTSHWFWLVLVNDWPLRVRENTDVAARDQPDRTSDVTDVKIKHR